MKHPLPPLVPVTLPTPHRPFDLPHTLAGTLPDLLAAPLTDTQPQQPRPDTAEAQVPALPDPGWAPQDCTALIDLLLELRQDMLAQEALLAPQIEAVAPTHRASARNFAHYLALRRGDRRALQEQLAALGLSSLGRSEAAVLANLDKVLGLLHRLAGRPWQDHSAGEPIGLHGGQRLLQAHSNALLGAAPAGRSVRIMVTLPSEAASDPALLRRLVDAGMDIARINCAHDEAPAWTAMAAGVRAAAQAAGRPVRVLMDLGGPKLRTGPIAAGPAVLKLQPRRDSFGRVIAPVTLGLRPPGSRLPVPGADAQLSVDGDWLARLRVGDELNLTDAREARRTLQVVACGEAGVRVESGHTLYLLPGTEVQGPSHWTPAEPQPGPRSDAHPAPHRSHPHSSGRPQRSPHCTRLQDIPCRPGSLFLRVGDRLRLTRGGIASPRSREEADAQGPAELQLACTLPEVFGQVHPGERVLFDDGRITGVIRQAEADGLQVDITHTRPGGSVLAADKGINLPDSALDLPALTDKDLADLTTVARIADLAGLSFVQRAEDVRTLRHQLQAQGAPNLGVLLKIETRRAFENLPELVLAAMAGEAAGLMIARGDLAVECGYERLAEVQEELLWAAEAAHLPVVWATQVLETLAKTGQPSRAEITDAAMGERAECVMLNKGPHIVAAMHTLDDILQRMQAHQDKKRSLLRALGAWQRR
ncbi:MAG: pyruvate kinase [Burkholderiales bacterium]|nr:pyruvate kinase [Burkholderiales bacterium]